MLNNFLPGKTVVMPILILLCMSHMFNDLLQSVVSASYPLLKDELSLTFTDIGIISLIYQISASGFQPIVGYIYDKRPSAYSIPIGMCFTLLGLLMLAFVEHIWLISASVFLIGIGSATLHPEASRITSLAAKGRRGLGQSLFQVGGNFGNALGPLLVAAIVSVYGRSYIALFCIIGIIAIIATRPISNWYKAYLNNLKEKHQTVTPHIQPPLRPLPTALTIFVLMILIFSKYIYMASLSNYYTFYLIEHFGVSVQTSQILLFVFLAATAAGIIVGGPIGDKIGRKHIIWISILGTAPFSILMPHANLLWTVVLSFCVGFMLSSAFPSILLYAQELLPNKLGLISGLFFGFAFGVAGVAAAVLGNYADIYGIEAIYKVCGYTPLFGFVAIFLPNLKK